MKPPKKNVSYFPVDTDEQALLLRARESDLVGRAAELVAMVDQIGEAKLTPADLELAIQLLVASRAGEGLDARFANLEARLKDRIEKGLAEIEGRLSKRLGGDDVEPPVPPPLLPTPQVPPTPPPEVAESSELDTVPPTASLAFRIGPEVISGVTAAQFYVAVWRWLFEHGRVRLADLPIGTAGKKRYEVAATPVHPTGKDFYNAAKPVPGAFLEVNLSRGDIVRRAKKYLDLYGVKYEVVVGTED